MNLHGRGWIDACVGGNGGLFDGLTRLLRTYNQELKVRVDEFEEEALWDYDWIRAVKLYVINPEAFGI